MKLIKNILLATIWLTFVFGVNGQIFEPIKWTIQTKQKTKNTADIIIKAKLDEGWHLYGTKLPDGGPKATTIKIKTLQNGQAKGDIKATSKLISSYDRNFEMELNWYKNEAIFQQEVTSKNPKNIYAQVSISYMVCNDINCLPPTEEILTIGEKTDNTTQTNILPTTTQKNNNTKKQSKPQINIDTTQTTNDSTTQQINAQNTKTQLWKPVIKELKAFQKNNQSNQSHTIWWIFIAGFIGGLIALFTPCVWPIIPMTVSFFLKRSDKKSGGRRDAILYGLSIIVIYVGLGLLITVMFGASALNSLSTSAVFNLIFFALLIIFAISFFGAFEITLPASWSNKMNQKADSTAGLLSILFMAFTLVLVSFSCTGPIIGTLLVEASVSGSLLAPIIGMLGFAIALAIPFSIFAFFPTLLKSIPKSGGWLNKVKVILGFLELALALKFLSVADLAYGWGILDRETFIALWITIFSLLGLYLLGKLRLPHDDQPKHTSVSGLLMGIISLSFAIYMLPGLWGAPLKAISAFAPPANTQDFNLYEDNVHAQFTDYELGMQYAKSVGKPALIDFTGYGCVNCRKMEVAVWTDPKVRQIINNDYILISLYVDDKTPLKSPYTIQENGKTRNIETIGDKWSYLQRVKFGANAQPFYLILDHNGNPKNYAYTFDENPKNFIEWLKK